MELGNRISDSRKHIYYEIKSTCVKSSELEAKRLRTNLIDCNIHIARIR